VRHEGTVTTARAYWHRGTMAGRAYGSRQANPLIRFVECDGAGCFDGTVNLSVRLSRSRRLALGIEGLLPTVLQISAQTWDV